MESGNKQCEEDALPEHFLAAFHKPRPERDLLHCARIRGIPIDRFPDHDIKGRRVCRYCGTPLEGRIKYCRGFGGTCGQHLYRTYCTLPPVGVRGKCQECGKDTNYLELHHIVPMANVQEMIRVGTITTLAGLHQYMLSQENLIYLCRECHAATQNKLYYKYGICLTPRARERRRPFREKLDRALVPLIKRKMNDPLVGAIHPYPGYRNLEVYLSRVNRSPKSKRFLFVGEAPGYRGCAATGIPFTSIHQIYHSRHPTIVALRDDLEFFSLTIPEIRERIRPGKRREFEAKIANEYSELTSRAFWHFIDEKRLPAPLAWNAFPWHPHEAKNLKTNRTPTAAEVREGFPLVRAIVKLFKPKKLVAVGRVAETALRNIFPEREDKIIYIRHPSHGGTREFYEGMADLYGTTIPQESTLDEFITFKHAKKSEVQK